MSIDNPETNVEMQYLELVKRILAKGFLKPNRTGTPAYTIPHTMLQHDLEKGFPLLTTKKMPFKIISVELEGFIKGITDKKWFQERNCHIWDEWCNPQKVPYGTDDETKKKMFEERDLGFIYGYQWRNFNSQGYDQLKTVVERLKRDPTDRRMIVSAWNPLQLQEMALPPCHVLYHVTVLDGRVNLCWFQRSCDLMLGIPFNLASYSLLTHLIAKETSLKPGIVTGFLSDVHIYENHLDGAKKQIQRTPRQFPQLEFKQFESIFTWTYDQCIISNYNPDDPISFPIAV